MNLYALNNSERKFAVVEGIVASASPPYDRTIVHNHRNVKVPYRSFRIEGSDDTFVYPSKFSVGRGQRVRFYENERRGTFVELAGIEVLSSTGLVRRKRCLPELSFK